MRLEEYVENVENGIVPPEPPFGATFNGRSSNSGIEYFRARETCCKHGMWPVVDLRWTKMLAEWVGDRKVLEVMAGPGWLAKALQIHGVDIVATDNESWNDRHSKATPLCTVLKMEAKEAVEKLGSEADLLLVSWPPYDETAVCDALEGWDKPVIYIGEGEGGCGPPDRFWNHFRELADIPEFPMVSWYGLHDYVQIGTYKWRGE